jgi:hypothetical protein
MRFKKYIIAVTISLALAPSCFTQVQELTEEQWELLKDEYAVSIIKLMIYRDTLDMEIDSLKSIMNLKDEQFSQCETELHALVGTTKEGVNDFRRKFEETEKRINSKTGTPADARSMYFDEVSNDKIRCLPEFSERFASMKKKLQDWEGYIPAVTTEGNYTVVKGDCLWKISILKYDSPYYWPAIWDANKNGVLNKDTFFDPRHKAVTNPNLIYPGQVLRIPTLSSTSKTESLEKFKKFRRERFIKK